MAMELEKSVAKLSNQIIGWRRKIHRQPELGLECYNTAAMVSEQLQKFGYDVKTGIAKTGVLGTLHGTGPGPVVALRVDMDALPIEEQTELPFASEIEGVMHACGHDGHTAIGLGVAAALAQIKDFNGTVKLIFQPGEESPGGAKAMVEEGVLESPRVDALFGCHIFPSLPEGIIGLRYGTMTAGNDEFIIVLQGVGGHAGYPSRCSDPIVAAGHLILAVQTIVSRSNDPANPLVVSITEINGGNRFNIIPDTVTLKGTIRSTEEHSREIALQRLKELVEGIKHSFDIQYSLQIIAKDSALICDQELTKFTEEILGNLIGRDRVKLIGNSSMGSEDLVNFSKVVPTTYLRIGSYEANNYVHNLHTPNFDFNEQILIDATYILSHLILQYLKHPDV
ncbi:hypothetical protein N752_03475 [Desulforamulus aquiferis]|nr:M20 family metallopeptidase [Desulforamulus aquiferis]RYD06749.1 hypothetical protein N752_03475 [Desulforamulus aquiferis]